MTRRTRHIAGTLALAAMTLFLVESVWASTCAPGMDMDEPAMAVADQASPRADDCAHGWNADAPDEPDEDTPRPCPFGPAAATQACTGIASLPARAAAAVAPSPEGTTSVFIELTERDLLLGAALFHPPRA